MGKTKVKFSGALTRSKTAEDLIAEINSRIQGGVEALVATKVRPCDRDSAGRYAIDKGLLRAGPLDDYLETSKYQAKLLAALRDLAKESYSSVEERNQCLVCAVETRRGTEGAKNRFVKEIMVCDVRNAILICLTVYRAMMNEQLDVPHDHVKIPIELLSGSTEHKSLMDTVGDIFGSIGVEDQASNMKEQTGEATGVVEDDEEDQLIVEEPVHNEFMLSFEDSEGEEEEDDEAIQPPVAEGPVSSEQSVVQVLEGVRVTEEKIAGANGGLGGVETSTPVATVPEAPTHNQEASIGRSLELTNGATNSPAARQTSASPTDGTSSEQDSATQTGASEIGGELRAPLNEGTSIVGSGQSESRKQHHDVTNVSVALFASAPANIDNQGVQPLDRSVDGSSLDETMYESATKDGGNSAEAGGVRDNEVMSDEVPGTSLDHEMTDASTHGDAQDALTPAQHPPNGEQVVNPGVDAEDGTIINHPVGAMFANGGAMIDDNTDQFQQPQVIEPAAIAEAGTEVGIEQVESEAEDVDMDQVLAADIHDACTTPSQHHQDIVLSDMSTTLPQHVVIGYHAMPSEEDKLPEADPEPKNKPAQPYKTEDQSFWAQQKQHEKDGEAYFKSIGRYRVEVLVGEFVVGPEDVIDGFVSHCSANKYFNPKKCSFSDISTEGYVLNNTESKARRVKFGKRQWKSAVDRKISPRSGSDKWVFRTQPEIRPSEVKSVLGPRGVYVSDLEVGIPKVPKLACKKNPNLVWAVDGDHVPKFATMPAELV
ncbi:hypothetical protein LTR27_003873 [Elasticomyces elasticus]|nr:hypothetical protein LTR27_003873 [Elasticomyces elasticus]